MKLIKVKNYKAMSEITSHIIINAVKEKPNITLGFATGKTPLGAYKKLAKAYKKRKVNFSKVKSFNLDEYYPIKRHDKKSFHYYMFKNLFTKTNMKNENINILNGEARNPKKECMNYEKKIKKTPIDIQILGIGENGHIAFNEPGSLKNSKTRLVELKHKAVKPRALTVGISTIMKSKRIILLASGKKKAKAIRCLIKCKPSKCCPATFLKKHKDFTVIIDRKAGKLL